MLIMPQMTRDVLLANPACTHGAVLKQDFPLHISGIFKLIEITTAILCFSTSRQARSH